MFSYIHIVIVLSTTFQSTDTAKNIFTINNKPPKGDGAFGDVFISEQDRDTMVRRNRRPNAVRKPFTLRTPMKYFENEGRRRDQNIIHVSQIRKKKIDK